MHFDHTLESARKLDATDELARFRAEFLLDDPDLIYLDGNSLGCLPRRTIPHLLSAIEQGWGRRLVRVWREGWMEAPLVLGSKLARLLGAREDEVLISDSTSVNLFRLAIAAARARPGRHRIVSDELNFPSDLHVLQGVVDLLGVGYRLELVSSPDGVSMPADAIAKALDASTALLALTHVAYKSGYLYDMAEITARAQRSGALVLWDLSHSVGAVPLDLNGCGVDLAVGCSYKYLNGGPGAPAFLYVKRELQGLLRQPVWGWLGSRHPFAFDMKFDPAPGIAKFRVGTAPMLSMQALEPGIDLLLEAGMDRLRRKSVTQTEYLIFLAQQWLTPLGFTVGSPLDAAQRGSHVSLQHPEAYRITQEMIEPASSPLRVVPDFREPDNVRLAAAPLYNTFSEIHQAIARIRDIVVEGSYRRRSVEKQAVT